MSEPEKTYVTLSVRTHSIKKNGFDGEFTLRADVEATAASYELLEAVAQKMEGLKAYGIETLSDAAVEIIKEDLHKERNERAIEKRGLEHKIAELEQQLSFARQEMQRLVSLESQLTDLSRLPLA